MKTRRPLAITLLCILMVIGTIGMLIQDLPKANLPAEFRFFLLCTAAVTFGCAVGMWRMSSLSVYVYACWAVLATLAGFALLGVFSLSALIVHIAVVAVSFYFICARSGSQAEP